MFFYPFVICLLFAVGVIAVKHKKTVINFPSNKNLVSFSTAIKFSIYLVQSLPIFEVKETYLFSLVIQENEIKKLNLNAYIEGYISTLTF